MNASSSALVVGKEGLRGRIETRPPDVEALSERVAIRLEDGRQMQVPADLLTAQDDGSFFIPLTLTQLEQTYTPAVVPERENITVPVVAEELQVGIRTVETGRVRIHKTVTEQEETVDLPLSRQRVVVEHVPVNRLCDGETPVVRQDGETTIIPVLVVEKRLLLKEEIHVRREQDTFHKPQRVLLRREAVHVERVPAQDNPEASEMVPD